MLCLCQNTGQPGEVENQARAPNASADSKKEARGGQVGYESKRRTQ